MKSNQKLTRHRHSILNPTWVKKRRMHYRVMPQWADGKCITVFVSALAGFIAGFGSCYFLHKSMPSAQISFPGLILLLLAVTALLFLTAVFVRGLYLKFIDGGWDVYY